MKAAEINTENQHWIKTLLVWLPSILVALFFVQNGLEKVFMSTELDKVGLSSTQIIIVGIVLLIATTFYLIDKTMLMGTIILATYMIGIVIIHIQKEKPFILAGLIVGTICLGAYLRKMKIIPKK